MLYIEIIIALNSELQFSMELNRKIIIRTDIPGFGRKEI